MDIEKLYQDVWAQVFAHIVVIDGAWAAHEAADDAAKEAVERFDHAKAQAVIAAKAAQT